MLFKRVTEAVDQIVRLNSRPPNWRARAQVQNDLRMGPGARVWDVISPRLQLTEHVTTDDDHQGPERASPPSASWTFGYWVSSLVYGRRSVSGCQCDAWSIRGWKQDSYTMQAEAPKYFNKWHKKSRIPSCRWVQFFKDKKWTCFQSENSLLPVILFSQFILFQHT